MPPIPPPRTIGFTTTTEVPLYWCAYGVEGRDRLLILHGGPGAHHDYLLPQMLRLASPRGVESRDLLFYDQRGGGRSRSESRDAEGNVTWQTNVGDLERVINELGVRPLTLVGYSWGGLLALLFAREAAAGRVGVKPSRLVLVDPAPISRRYREQFEREFARRQAGPEIQAMREELAASGLRERDLEAYRQRSFELSVAGYFADPRKTHDLTPFRVTGRVQQSVWESLGDYDLLADPNFRAIDAPILIVHGRQDPIPLESSETCASALHATLVVLDQCGHVPYVEQPDGLFDAIEKFLASTR
ncbi:MAG TPA: alpha/beta hydrolase [Gemmatimonadaceae bacterium]|nr:alpha/beta hydrolase [Gemmatimonadaceae bacterium]